MTRRATLDDVSFLVGLLGEGHRPDALDQVQRRVEDSTTYVICADDAPVGRLRVVRTDDHIEIAGIQIDPAWQSQGIGTAVINQVLDEGSRRRLPVELDVGKDNPDAERLYTRLGFRRVAEKGTDYRMRRL